MVFVNTKLISNVTVIGELATKKRKPLKHVTLNLGDKRQVDTTFCIIQPVLLVYKVRFIASCGFHAYCLIT